MQRLQPEIKDLADQRSGRYIITIVSLGGQVMPVYVDDFAIQDGLLVGIREIEGQEPETIIIAPADTAKLFHTDILTLKTWEVMEREGTVEAKARQKLMAELTPEAIPVFVPGVGIMPKAQAEYMSEALTAMQKSRENVPAGEGTYR